jgi:hypothetical protein
MMLESLPKKVVVGYYLIVPDAAPMVVPCRTCNNQAKIPVSAKRSRFREKLPKAWVSVMDA